MSIARVLYKEPHFFLFDECTSALDSESKFIIEEKLEKLKIGRTTLNINSATVYSDLAHYKWIIDCNATSADTNTGAMTSWTTAKDIQMLARDYGSSNEGYLFATHYWDGAGSNVFMQPRLSITAIA